MPAAPAFKRLFDALRRGAGGGLRALLLVSMVLFAGQPTGALAAHHAMNSPGSATGLSDMHSTEAAQTHDACCQPAEEQPACPDCAAFSCTTAPVTLTSAVAIQIFQRPLRHVFIDPAFALSPYSQPPDLGPPRA
jgi:hypothetical protein